jgi:hypothetical protein
MDRRTEQRRTSPRLSHRHDFRWGALSGFVWSAFCLGGFAGPCVQDDEDHSLVNDHLSATPIA